MTPNSTTKLGISVFDQAFGGIYLHRPTIVCGRRKSGKFVVATQLMVKTLLVGERIIFFTAKNPEDILRAVPRDTVDLGEAVENGQLLICPYSGMQRSGSGPYAPLPFPQAFEELTSIVRENNVSYAIFDSVVPWTAIYPVEAMQEHVEKFFSTLDSLGLTSLLLLPEPASSAALSLATTIRELCPINIDLAAKNFGAEFTLQVTKYQGMHRAAKNLPQKFALDLTPGVGFAAQDGPAAKTLGDLKELETTTSRQAALPKKSAAPSFRPFLSGGPSSFAVPAAAPGAPAPAGAPAAVGGLSTFDIPRAPAAAPSVATAVGGLPTFDIPRPPAAAPSAPAAAGGLPTFDIPRPPTAAPSAPAAAGGVPTFDFQRPPAAAPSAPAAAGGFPTFGIPHPPEAALGAALPAGGFPTFDIQRPTENAPGADLAGAAPKPATSGAQDGFSFASVIDLPEFANSDQPAKKAAGQEPPPVNPPQQGASGIQFSSVIR